MSERLSLATAAGFPFVLLAFHVAMGTAALATGYVAIVARKGGTWHRRSGHLFVTVMLAMCLSAIVIAIYEGKSDITPGALTAYLVFTAWITLRPIAGLGRTGDVALMIVAFLLAADGYLGAITALGRPGRQVDGVPAAMLFFLSTVILLAAIGDARMIRAGGVSGARRIARHLWRMCYGLFIASGSFVAQLAALRSMPGWMRSVPVIVALAAGPLVVMLWWFWRVRLRGVLPALPGVYRNDTAMY